MKKRIFCFFLAVILTVFAFPYAVSADDDTPIIIVPGLFGSRLYDDPEFNNRWFGEYGTAAEFSEIDAQVFYVKPPVNLQKAAEFGAGNKYKALCNELSMAYPKREIYFFSYDFTKGTKDAAARLNNFINSLGTKVNIVCASYGGLVATHYFALDNNNYGKVLKTVCIGVPFEGSVYAELAAYKNLADNSLMAELLPTGKYMNAMGENGGTDRDYLYSDGKSVMLKNDNAYYAIGAGRITASAAKYNENGVLTDVSFDANGDGIVTALSSTVLNGAKNVKTFNISHDKLVSSSEVTKWVRSVLDGGGDFSNDIAPSAYDVIKVNGPANLEVGGNGAVLQEPKGDFSSEEYGQFVRLDGENKLAAVYRDDTAVTLRGTADGFVNLYIRRFESNNKLICDNAFIKIPVNKQTVIKTVASDDEMWLYIDKNGDGVYEENACSKSNTEHSFVTKTPVPSVKAGTYNKAFKVELTTDTVGAAIYYTLDGTNPSENGILYDGEFKIEENCTLKAVAVREGYATGAVLEAEYTINKLGFVITIFVWILIIAAAITAVAVIINKKKKKVTTDKI